METQISFTFSLSSGISETLQEEELQETIKETPSDAAAVPAKDEDLLPESPSVLSSLSLDSSDAKQAAPEDDSPKDETQASAAPPSPSPNDQCIWRRFNVAASASVSLIDEHRQDSPFLDDNNGNTLKTTDSVEHHYRRMATQPTRPPTTTSQRAIAASAVRASTTSKKPKRPVSAYNWFFKVKRQELIEETEGAITFSSIGKMIGKLWHECPARERQRFDRWATQLRFACCPRQKADMARYRREAKLWREQRRQRMRGTMPVPKQEAANDTQEKNNRQEDSAVAATTTPEDGQVSSAARIQEIRIPEPHSMATFGSAPLLQHPHPLSYAPPPPLPLRNAFHPPPFPGPTQISYRMVRVKESELGDFIAKLTQNNFRLDDE